MSKWESYRRFVVGHCESKKTSAIVPRGALGCLYALSRYPGDIASRLKKHLFYGNEWTHTGLYAKQPDTEDFEVSGNKLRVLHSLLGIADEATELISWLQENNYFRDKDAEIDRVNIVEEFGDLLWYLTLGLDALGMSLDQLIDVNVAKLKKRYPDGFTEFSASNRDRQGERETMEQALQETAG